MPARFFVTSALDEACQPKAVYYPVQCSVVAKEQPPTKFLAVGKLSGNLLIVEKKNLKMQNSKIRTPTLEKFNDKIEIFVTHQFLLRTFSTF